MNGLLGPMMVIVWKDLLLELRSKDLVVSIVVFGLLVVVVFNFALNNTPGRSDELAPGILWAAFAFSAILALRHSLRHMPWRLRATSVLPAAGLRSMRMSCQWTSIGTIIPWSTPSS